MSTNNFKAIGATGYNDVEGTSSNDMAGTDPITMAEVETSVEELAPDLESYPAL
ncbi:MAG: hypothetical protein HWE10_13495 [Gammaproteobacteria bacterium]|nr:hypothetical protein [Gammaproteobacteria bacterium]